MVWNYANFESLLTENNKSTDMCDKRLDQLMGESHVIQDHYKVILRGSQELGLNTIARASAVIWLCSSKSVTL